MENKHLFWLVVCSLVVLALWASTPIITLCYFQCDTTKSGTFGDLFGSINALFSGLALLGIIATILLQQKELSLSTKELRNSATALQRQVSLSADAAKLQVLPSLIQNQRAKVESIGGKTYERFGSHAFSASSIKDTIDLVKIHIEEGHTLYGELNARIVAAASDYDVKDAKRQLEAMARMGEIDQLVLPELELLLQYTKDLTELYTRINDHAAKKV